MLLLVSVRDVADARAAMAGGADIIDAKDPSLGALGAVSTDVLRAIREVVAAGQPLSAALGDVQSPAQGAAVGALYARLGLAFGKVGFAGMPAGSSAMVARTVRAVQGALDDGASIRTRVIAVAYADAHRVGAPMPQTVLDGAAAGGAAGVLLDTADKEGDGLFSLWGAEAVTRWVARAHALGLTTALAGKLSAVDLTWACAAGADIAGVRGAACLGGRTAAVSAERTRRLVEGVRGGVELTTRR